MPPEPQVGSYTLIPASGSTISTSVSTSWMPACVTAKARRVGAGAGLPEKFYERGTGQVARNLLGAVLRCTTSDGVASGRIV